MGLVSISYLLGKYRFHIKKKKKKKKRKERFIVNLCSFRLNGSSVRKLITSYNNRTVLHYFQKILRAFDFRFIKQSWKIKRMFVYIPILPKWGKNEHSLAWSKCAFRNIQRDITQRVSSPWKYVIPPTIQSERRGQTRGNRATQPQVTQDSQKRFLSPECDALWR